MGLTVELAALSVALVGSLAALYNYISSLQSKTQKGEILEICRTENSLLRNELFLLKQDLQTVLAKQEDNREKNEYFYNSLKEAGKHSRAVLEGKIAELNKEIDEYRSSLASLKEKVAAREYKLEILSDAATKKFV